MKKVLDGAVLIQSPGGIHEYGIIVTPKKLVTALHGHFPKKSVIDIFDRHGISRQGFVKESWYDADVVDIALIELNDDSASFDSYMPVHVKLVV